MNHRFYQKTRKEQKRIQVLIAVGALFFNVLVVLITSWIGLYFLVAFSAAVTLSVIAPFFDTPSLVAAGNLKYYSPLLLAEKEKRGVIALHGGTLFDYVFVIDRRLNGRQRTQFIIHKYLEGLLALIEANQHSANLKIKGTSYILNARTAEKLGFRVVKTDAVQKLLLIYNYVNLSCTISLAKARLTFPNLREINTFEAELSHLAQRKAFIENFHQKLTSTLEQG